MKRSAMFTLCWLSVSILLAQKLLAGEIILTDNWQFNEGTLDHVAVGYYDVRLPAAGTGIGSWSTPPALPMPLRDLAVAYYNEEVYVTGGWTGSSYSKIVYYASRGGYWTTETDSLPEGVRDHAMVATSGYVYVLGGRSGGGPTDVICYSEIDFDKTLRPWKTSTVPLPQPLWGHSAVTYAGFVYVIGGSNQATEGTAVDYIYYASIQVDGSLGSWVQTTSLPFPRNQHTATVANGVIYVVGGYDGSGVNQSSIFYAAINADGSISSWNSTTALPLPLHGHAAAIENGVLTIVGGVKQGAPDRSQDSVYIALVNADGTLGSWTRGTNYPVRVAHGASFSVPGTIYVLGGYREPSTIYNTAYSASFSTGSAVSRGGTYLSPAIDCGLTTTIASLSWNATLNGQNLAVRYRLAGSNKVWGAWSGVSPIPPVSINSTARYVQFQIFFSGNGSATPVLNDVTVSVVGATYVCGSVGGQTWTKASSPYVALCNIYVNGKLTIEPGVIVKFKSGYGMYVASELYAEGTQTDTIVFTSLSEETDHWTGLQFGSTTGSTMTYCAIRNAGQSTPNANIYSSSTQPALRHCRITQSTGYGIRLSSADVSIRDGCVIDSCTETPLYCSSSSPTIEDCTITSTTEPAIYCSGGTPSIAFSDISGNIGIYCSSSSPDVYYNTIHDCATYGVYLLGNSVPVLFGNVYTGNGLYNIAHGGGFTSTTGAWHNDGGQPYVILDDVTIYGCLLSIEPGLNVLFADSAGLQIGYGGTTGSLNAVGKPDSIIVFTSLSGATNGWDGLHFGDYSDYGGATSVLDYCVVENAGQNGWGVNANVYCYSTTQPSITNCVIQKTSGSGVYLSSSNLGAFRYNLLDSNSVAGVWCYNSSPRLDSNIIRDNVAYGVYLYGNSFPDLVGNTYAGNGHGIAVGTEYISASGTWHNDGEPYVVLGDVRVGNNALLTLEPGITAEFDSAAGLEVGYNPWGGGGRLSAVGTPDSLIVLTSLSGATNGWDGLYFDQYSDDGGAASTMDHCVVENAGQDGWGRQANVYCESTTQPSMTNCVFRGATGSGVYLSSSSPIVQSNNFQDNTVYGICLQSSSFPHISGNLFSGNSHGIGVAASYISSSGTWHNTGGEPYGVFGDVVVYYGASLTIEPGVELRFASGAGMEIGYYSGNPGRLNAVGKADSLIVFTSLSGATNGWDGLYFDQYSDDGGAASTMDHCVVENAGQDGWGWGAQANVYCWNTTQPSIANCIIRRATGSGVYLSDADLAVLRECTVDSNSVHGIRCENGSTPVVDSTTVFANRQHGLYISSSSPLLRNVRVMDNDSAGVFCTGTSQPVIGNDPAATCWLYGNRTYDVYNNTTNTINARHNFWAQPDSAAIAGRIYDKHDDLTRGLVVFMPFGNLDDDVRPLYIVVPVDTVRLDSLVTPRAVVRNAGKNAETFPVIFQIASFYGDTVQVGPLAPGDTVAVNFESWIARPAGTYIPICFTDLATDEFSGYDTARGFFIVKSGPGPEIHSISPNYGGNTGSVTVTVRGKGFIPETSLKLSAASLPDIPADSAETEVVDSTLIIATFDLRGAATGPWNVVATNPGSEPGILHDGFTVKTGVELLWIDIIGRDRIRLGQATVYSIVCGNSGNINSGDQILLLSIPTGVEYAVDLAYPTDSAIPWRSYPVATEGDSIVYIPVGVSLWQGTTCTFRLTLKVTTFPQSVAGSGDQAYELRQNEVSVRASLLCKDQSQQFLDEATNAATGDPTLDAALEEYHIGPQQFLSELRRLVGKYIRDHALIAIPIAMVLIGIIAFLLISSYGLATVAALNIASAVVTGSGFLMTLYSLSTDLDRAAKIARNRNLPVVSSMSPEDKYGLSGFDLPTTSLDSLRRFIPATCRLPYRIDFWNKEDATAPAQQVLIVDTLDTDVDFSTFAFTEFGFLKWRLPLDTMREFNIDVDLRPDDSLIVNVAGSFDSTTGVISWLFRSLDPATGLPPEDPMAGFLPAMSDSGYEIGWVDYVVLADSGLQTGTQITNQAFVKFDIDVFKPAPKEGPYLNTIDAGVPWSAVFGLPDTVLTNTFPVCWDGQDDSAGSGLRGFDIYVSENYAPYEPWIIGTTTTCSTYTGAWGSCYRFYSIARDNVGHMESIPSPADDSTCVDSCNCTDFCDLDSDSVINAVDVVIMVNYVFMNNDLRCQWPDCPGDNGNWDCDNGINLVDVVMMVNYVYHASGIGPCDPCPH